MTTFPGSPKILKGGIVLLDPETSAVKRVIALQYNPETLTRTLEPETYAEGNEGADVLRITGPPGETIKLEAVVDATDQIEFPDDNPDAVESGIHPQLAAMETMLYPESADLQANDALASAGTLEIVPMQSPLVVFVWSKNRSVPVKITEFTVTEEAFDPYLNPIRAKVSLSMRVLNVNDVPFNSKGGSLYMNYHQQKENLAKKASAATLSTMGLGEAP
jgi:hypothetical protein